jgi:hypothetical protein
MIIFKKSGAPLKKQIQVHHAALFFRLFIVCVRVFVQIVYFGLKYKIICVDFRSCLVNLALNDLGLKNKWLQQITSIKGQCFIGQNFF